MISDNPLYSGIDVLKHLLFLREQFVSQSGKFVKPKFLDMKIFNQEQHKGI